MGDGTAIRFAAPERAGQLVVADAPIEWVAWEGLPTPVLLHGARAHRGWWAAVVTELRSRALGAIALDFSGNGDSGHRRSYSPELWAAEAVAVAADLLDRPAVLVGHSMGGQVALAAAALYPQAVAGVILLDTKVMLPSPETGERPRGLPARPLRLYPTADAAVASFRLEPAQPHVDDRLVREIAAQSLREEDGGWRWKFDAAIAQRWTDSLIAGFAERVSCPVRLIRGGQSALTSSRTAADLETLTGAPVPEVVIPGAHHHLILDQPELVGAAITECLLQLSGDWA